MKHKTSSGTPTAFCLGPALILSLLASTAIPGGEPAPGLHLEARFRNPPGHRRILKIIHNFPGDAGSRARLIQELVRRGFGGLVANVNFSEYLRSEARWEEFRDGVEAARAAGLTLWLYDEQGYPSAAAGGLTLEGHPGWEAQGLFCVVADQDEGREVEVLLPRGKIVHLKAYPVREGAGILSEGVDLQDRVGEDRRVRWKRPGKWRICGFIQGRLYEGTHAEMNLFRKRPYPNLLQEEPMERFVEITHEAYRRRFHPLGDRFEAIFTDEPSMMNVFIKEMPHPALPWAPGLAETFRRQKGYDLLPVLPALVSDFGPRGKTVRCHFWDVIGKEVARNYFGRIQLWCRARGIASTGHLLAEEDIGSHVGFYGNFYACASRLEIPGIDCLTSIPASVPWHVAKLLGSVACRMGRPKTMSETSDHAQHYRPSGDRRPRRDVTAREILGTVQRLYSAGINTITSYYSWAGLGDGAVLQINQEIGRLGVLLEGGNHRCDIALLYPLESAWSHFTPQRVWARSPEISRIDAIYRDACYNLFHGLRDFDIIDSEGLAAGRPEGGALRLGAERYRVLILPAVDVLPLPALQRARELVRSGGAVIAVGEVPVNTPGAFPGAEAQKICREIFGGQALSGQREASRILLRPGGPEGPGIFLPERSGWLLTSLLDRILEPDLSAPDGSPLRYTHRRKEDRDFYFLINDSGAPWTGGVVPRGVGAAELWDPSTGTIQPVNPDSRGRFAVTLPAYGSTFLSFPKARGPGPRKLPAGIPDLVEAVDLKKATGRDPLLAVHAPAHVQASKPAPGSPPLPAAISARITTGGVDTWCFAELRFPEPADLTRYRALEFHSSVPSGGEGRVRLLVILNEEGGGESRRDYFADAHRSLEIAGPGCSAVPFESLQLAGWASDPDGKLDLDRIRAIRIGWGGHMGQAGETITFRLEGVSLLRTP